jgi:alkylhydroperoxidase/carboxymuconolactone decarboxylase family protein YurZ
LSHGAAAASHLGDSEIVEKVKANFLAAPISTKLKALLLIAGKVQQDGKLVTEIDVQAARAFGATDLEIHDTVLIAAAFSMYNRYVDGLATVQPTDSGVYEQMGKHLAEEGYTKPSIRHPVDA